MQEFELFELVDLALSRVWGQMQWWAGITFGLLALTNFAGTKLKLLHVITLSLLYVAFTVYSSLNLNMQIFVTAAFLFELERLGEAGQLSLGGIDALAAYSTTAQRIALPTLISCIGLFVAALTYLWSSYLQHRRGSASKTSTARLP